MKKQVMRLLNEGKVPMEAVLEAARRNVIARLGRWTGQLEAEPSKENIEQVVMDMELGQSIGAETGARGSLAYRKAEQALLKAGEQRIKDLLPTLQRYSTTDSVTDMVQLISESIFLGADGLGATVQSGWGAAGKALAEHAAEELRQRQAARGGR